MLERLGLQQIPMVQRKKNDQSCDVFAFSYFTKSVFRYKHILQWNFVSSQPIIIVVTTESEHTARPQNRECVKNIKSQSGFFSSASELDGTQKVVLLVLVPNRKYNVSDSYCICVGFHTRSSSIYSIR